MSTSDLEKLTEELQGLQGPPGPDGPDNPTVEQATTLAANHGVNLSEPETESLANLVSAFKGSKGGQFFGLVTGNMDPPVGPDLAAQALAANINAAANGTLIAPGLEFKQKLTATVHDTVNLDFKSSYFKTTKGETTYEHKGNVYIDATDVRLTASNIRIYAWEERNTVSDRKESYRYISNIGVGSASGLFTSGSNNNATAVGGDFSFLNMSIGGLRLGFAGVMSHYGDVRKGKKLLEIDSTKSKWDKGANIFLTAAMAYIII
ncbi:hypothetical protein [Bordetella sp. 2513F-2]